MGKRIEHIVIQDFDEQHAPPSQNVLLLEVIPAGGNLKDEIISLTISKYDCDNEQTALHKIAQLCVNGDVFFESVNLIRKMNQ